MKLNLSDPVNWILLRTVTVSTVRFFLNNNNNKMKHCLILFFMFIIFLYFCEKVQAWKFVKFLKIRTYRKILYAYAAISNIQYKQTLRTIYIHLLSAYSKWISVVFLHPSQTLKPCATTFHEVFLVAKQIYVFIIKCEKGLHFTINSNSS